MMNTSFTVLCNTEDNVSILYELHPTIRDNEDRCGYCIIAYDIPFVEQTIANCETLKVSKNTVY